MLIVNNVVPDTVSYYPSDTKANQAAPMAETYAGLTSELNAKLIKELIAQLDTPNKPDKLDAIRTTLGQYGLDTSGEDFNNSKLLAAVERLKTGHDVAKPLDDVAEMLANQEERVKSTAQAVSDIQREIATNRIKANYSLSQFSAEKQRAAQEPVPELKSSDDEISIHTSYAELADRMALAIAKIKEEYLDVYADLMLKYTKMYEAYNTHVQGAATNAVSTGSDGNNVKFDSSVMKKGYDDFRSEINGIDLGSVKNWDELTAKERKSAETTLAPAFKVNDSGKIDFNLEQYSAAPNYPSGISDGKVSTASYQAWLASFNAGGSALQSNMQAFAQRYNSVNSIFDNENKELAGSTAKWFDAANSVIKNFS